MNRIFNLTAAHPSWHPCLQHALQQLNPLYLKTLKNSTDWLPGPSQIFNAFSLPLSHTYYVLFGESPYPRKTSANGYAFWDAAVQNLWSATGLAAPVNRATSLRNLIKMLLVAEGLLTPDDTSQKRIAQLDKNQLIQSNPALFRNFLTHGFLLLNATPVLRIGKIQKDAKEWRPFVQAVLNFLIQHRPHTTLILLGNIAALLKHINPGLPIFTAEHPYNLSFISNPAVLNFFRPLSLLRPTPVTIKSHAE